MRNLDDVSYKQVVDIIDGIITNAYNNANYIEKVVTRAMELDTNNTIHDFLLQIDYYAKEIKKITR